MKDLIDHVKNDCTEIDREDRFDQMLDENYDFHSVGGPFKYMVPSQVLKEMDPTAYRCGVNDYMDGEDTYEIGGETYDKQEVEEARDQFVNELEDRLETLEDDISEIESESDDADHSTIDEHNRLEGERDAVIDQIEAAKNYQF